MRFDILTIFPEMIDNYCAGSILSRGQKAGILEIVAHNFREWTLNKQRHVDDTPYGGGPGMILQIEPIYRCLENLGLVKDGKKISSSVIPAKAGIQDNGSRRLDSRLRGNDNGQKTKILIMDPAGKKFDQKMAEKFSKLDRLVFICGRYEGFDERIYKFVDEKISVGDYVLAGGELPALTVVEATSRLIPGVLGNVESLKEETFNRVTQNAQRTTPKTGHIMRSTQEYPQYTRPENFMGLKVPKVLLSGDHKKIEEWRKLKSK